MLATGVELLAALTEPPARVLDLGGGTGALSAAVLERLPQARVTVLDVDVDMLAEARGRLAGFGDRVAYHEGTFQDPLPAADAVVASLALHHVHDLGQKARLYRAIHASLAPGGVFLNLDAAVSEGPRVKALAFDRWAAHMGEHGIPEAEARRHFAAWAEEDRYSPWMLSSQHCGGLDSPRSSASGDAGSRRSAARYGGNSASARPLPPGRAGPAPPGQGVLDSPARTASAGSRPPTLTSPGWEKPDPAAD